MRGSVLLKFNEFYKNLGADLVNIYVNGSLRKKVTTDGDNEYITNINTGDTLRVDIVGSGVFPNIRKIIKIYRKDYTTDNNNGNMGVVDTLISQTSSVLDTVTLSVTVATVFDAYNYFYVIDAQTDSGDTYLLTESNLFINTEVPQYITAEN